MFFPPSKRCFLSPNASLKRFKSIGTVPLAPVFPRPSPGFYLGALGLPRGKKCAKTQKQAMDALGLEPSYIQQEWIHIASSSLQRAQCSTVILSIYPTNPVSSFTPDPDIFHVGGGRPFHQASIPSGTDSVSVDKRPCPAPRQGCVCMSNNSKGPIIYKGQAASPLDT